MAKKSGRTTEETKARPRRKGSAPAASPVVSTAHEAPKEKPRFPIVGIGASAGGLEALELFLRGVPAGSGVGFVVVQHLDPTHKGVMPELLQRATKMPVVQAKDRQRVEPGHVYVIPPNRDMSILRGVLHLFEPAAPRGLRLPIDYFFRSLAQDMKELAVGVVLSGMGTDGTLGLRAIKDESGLVLVQEPSTAKFDGMPCSAIDAGLADFVGPAGNLPARLLEYLTHAPLARPEPVLPDKSQSSLEKVVLLLRTQTGHDFSQYKKSTLYRRVERRMGIHQIDTISRYVRFLQTNAQELDLLFKEVLIGVTSFFRDPEEWERLRVSVLPALLAGRPPGTQIRAWVPGCSTGEEAYSLAMVFREAAEQSAPLGRYTLQVFATDLNRDAVERARNGVFPSGIAGDISPQRLARFFVKEEGSYRVAREIREMVVFAPQNVVMDPPFTKLDILVCRNLLIYFEPELQQKLLPVFHFALRPGGILFLGTAENLGAQREFFEPVEGARRVFRRSEKGGLVVPVEFPTTFYRGAAVKGEGALASVSQGSIQSVADQLILSHFAPAAVLVTDKGDILYVSGRTGKYLEPAAGKANWNIFAMAREGLRYELPEAFRAAAKRKGAVTLPGLSVATDGGTQTVDISVQLLQEPESLKGAVLLVFHDRPTVSVEASSRPGGGKLSPAASARVAELQTETRRLRTELQRVHEQMQSSQEELMSANEEYQSANEEMQSTNEELTTSREEMQSLNEELQTVNAELQSKVDDLSRTSNDMKNLLDSTDVATVFLDGALRVRRFTTLAGKMIRLIPGDVGRPFSDIAAPLLYPGLGDDAREVLRTLAFFEKEVVDGEGRSFRVRVMPYRTMEDRIDGVVITYTDITSYRKPVA